MKLRFWNLLPGIIILLAAVLLSARDLQKGGEIPEDVQAILSASCYACHTTDAGSKDALKAVDFKKWDDYGSVKKIAILNNIREVVEAGKMPPGKYLSRYPDKALSSRDQETIVEWSKQEAARAME